MAGASDKPRADVPGFSAGMKELRDDRPEVAGGNEELPDDRSAMTAAM